FVKDEEKKDVWHPEKFVHQEVSGLENIHESPAAVSAESGRVEDSASQTAPKIDPIKAGVKVGRNQPCICGSGRKFKQCCGRTG
ncbi:MAG: SEC-C domain-containing protein, partial [Planctomycetes bacterium]|nr:SEC-C domain-containing protein [Planctomycetota bacterium]